ncbi:hypothetical protein CYMTET_46657 [Cymbomonas tetramitiformis]|uniref:Uncharacterized protein n=1 Tax=Cymbomonas tetramitiformis TaxID=36881 RepID=A0AAE0EXD6_9CHLO|nr:hypothetical protein CYMTET_46657 [Cymbomonas tetramitiformis]
MVCRATSKLHTMSSDSHAAALVRMLHGRPTPPADAYSGIPMSRGLTRADAAAQERLARSIMATMRDAVMVAGKEVYNASGDHTYMHYKKMMPSAQKRSGRRRKFYQLITREMARLEKGTQSLYQRLQACTHAADGVGPHLLHSKVPCSKLEADTKAADPQLGINAVANDNLRNAIKAPEKRPLASTVEKRPLASTAHTSRPCHGPLLATMLPRLTVPRAASVNPQRLTPIVLGDDLSQNALQNSGEDLDAVRSAILLELEALDLVGSRNPNGLVQLEEVGCLSSMQQVTFHHDPVDMVPREEPFHFQPFSLQDMPPLEDIDHLPQR